MVPVLVSAMALTADSVASPENFMRPELLMLPAPLPKLFHPFRFQVPALTKLALPLKETLPLIVPLLLIDALPVKTEKAILLVVRPKSFDAIVLSALLVRVAV